MKIDVILITSWIVFQVEQFLSVEPLTKVFKIWKSWWKYDDDTFKWSKKPQVKRVAHKKLGSRWTWQNVINETNSYNRSQYTKTYCRYVAQNVAVSLLFTQKPTKDNSKTSSVTKKMWKITVQWLFTPE